MMETEVAVTRRTIGASGVDGEAAWVAMMIGVAFGEKTPAPDTDTTETVCVVRGVRSRKVYELVDRGS